MKKKKRKFKIVNKTKFILFITIQILLVIFIIKGISSIITKAIAANAEEINTEVINEEKPHVVGEQSKQKPTDWELVLANYDNLIPEDFEIELEDIDETRQFDARAIKYLNQMMNDMRKDGITNIWIQSAYRSVKTQKKLYEDSIQKYLNQGKTQKESEDLTLKYINKPGSSDHNLGLAVDFNYVEEKFEELEGFKWLTENAEKYGFILRYPKDKEKQTGIKYEPWHWRYVGEKHAKEMNRLNMCLEEYVEYLSK